MKTNVGVSHSSTKSFGQSSSKLKVTSTNNTEDSKHSIEVEVAGAGLKSIQLFLDGKPIPLDKVKLVKLVVSGTEPMSELLAYNTEIGRSLIEVGINPKKSDL